MAAAGKSSGSLRREEYDFTKLILSKMFYLFRCINYHLTAKYKTEKRNFFSNFKRQKHCRILLVKIKNSNKWQDR